MKKTKPLILITNDDGISAPGIRALIDVMSDIGEVVVVARINHKVQWATQSKQHLVS
jgi:broad specificity polyphosphatase/5'/3'-nucleotidase SurE